MDANVKHGCLIGCVASTVLMLVMLVGLVMLFAFMVRGCSRAIGAAETATTEALKQKKPADAVPEFRKVWSLGEGDEDAPKIVRVPLTGEISEESRPGSWFDDEEDGSARTALGKIHAATADKDIRGLFLEIESPGGGVTMSDILNDAVRRFRAVDTNRFVFVLMGDHAFSGGYYVAAAADYIMARPTTFTGSIGVIIPAFNAAGLAQKVGVESVAIASAANKDLLDPLKPVDPAHVAILQKAVDQMYERFLMVVAQGRHLPKDVVRPLADGRIFTAQDALANRLIDGIGYREEAIAKIAELARAKDVRIYRYEDATSLRRFLSSSLLSSEGVIHQLDARLGKAATPTAEFRAR